MKKPSKKQYKGCLKLTFYFQEDVLKVKIIPFGDWTIKTKTRKMFSKPRFYTVNCYIKQADGSLVLETQQLLTKIYYEDISMFLQTCFKEACMDIQQAIILEESYVTLSC